MLARMESDDAVDLLGELDDERRERIVELLPALQRRRVRALAGYDPATAGGLMSPDFIALAPTEQVAQALRAVRDSDLGAGTLTTVYLLDADRRLCGSVFVVTLLRSDPHTPLPAAASSGRTSLSTRPSGSGRSRSGTR